MIPSHHACGYSQRSLVEKLGIKPGMRIAILHPPRGYRTTLGKLPRGVTVTSAPRGVTVTSAPRGVLPFIHLFTADRALLERQLPALLRALTPDGALWVSWPKKARVFRPTSLKTSCGPSHCRPGWSTLKVAAVDEIWSGLKAGATPQEPLICFMLQST